MLTLCPQPQHLQWNGDQWPVSVADLSARLAACRVGSPPLPELPRHDDSVLDEEGYRLEITCQGASVTCGSDQGYFYAVQTLLQICHQCTGQAALPGVQIDDSPWFPDRGVLLDISRDRVPTMAQIYRLVDLWSGLKYNRLQLYMEAAFAYEGHEAAWRDRSPFTAEEVRALDSYCQQRGMTLMPNQNTFGHMERWLDLPEYAHLAENRGGCVDPNGNFRNHSFCLNPLSEQSVDFVADLLDQLLPCFTSRTVNINADETFDLGVGASRQRCADIGKGQVYMDYLRRIHELCQARGYRMQFWSDIVLNYPHLLDQVPADATVMNWGYEAEHPFADECARLQAAGLDFQVVSATGTFAALTGRWRNCRLNVINAAHNGRRFGASGFWMSEWGDFGHAQPWCAAYPGYLIGATAAWNPNTVEDFNTEQALQQLLAGNSTLTLALFRLGDLYLSTETDQQLPFVSVFGALLCNQMTNRHMKKVQHWHRAGFEQALQQCHQLDAALQGLGTADPEQAFMREELLLTTRLAAHASALGMALSEIQDYRVEQLSTTARAALASELASLLPEYDRVWLQRSRPGGLDASRARLEFLLALYRGAVRPTRRLPEQSL
ncbi:hypothetical protein E4656_06875 [Natronospirillum operosum]|uniref:beta-N-acetylhexosaminidase n=1 Tax=Natronospirillum operosum TaxID=2759953 RepID=A0A4Z0WBI7_9GAMM|nr:family 20 glycosylhydrolase [Natronospirillum operosum]TGG93905.1 hypothetical protein E4656_06875 [Natronospirillum operosum]